MKHYKGMVFLRFYERRNKFRYQLKQNLKDKNKMKRELSSCIIQKFNGYELLRNNLNSFEKKDFIPLDIVYEPTLDENKKNWMFFCARYFYRVCWVYWKKSKTKKNIWKAELQDSAITATIILWNLKRKWKNIYLAVLVKLGLLFLLIMGKL